MSIIVQLLNGIREYIKGIEGVRDVTIRGGLFDDEAVKRMSTREGELQLSFLGAQTIDERAGGSAVLYASFGAYIAASGRSRITDGIAILEKVAARVLKAGSGDDDGFGVPWVMPGTLGSLENLYSKDTDKQGVSIYGLSFAIPIAFGSAVFDPDMLPQEPIDVVVNDEQMSLDYGETI